MQMMTMTMTTIQMSTIMRTNAYDFDYDDGDENF